MGETRDLADFVCRTRFSDIPASTVEKIKVYTLDNLAAGFVGSTKPWTQAVGAMLDDLGGNPQATCFNRPRPTDISRAALLNGVAMGAFEVEHIGHVAHPSATVFPASLAVAERDHRGGQDLITALAVGYEVVCRVGEAQTGAVEIERGFHNPGANGTFGAAAAAGKLLGLDGTRLAWALGIAGSSSAGIVEFVWEGAMTKRLHLGRATQLGLESALLAQRGVSGPTTVIEGPYGYLHAFSPSPHIERLLPGLGAEWLLDDLTIKAYPVHASGQAIVHAIQAHKARAPIDAATVERVRVTTRGHAPEKRHLDPAPSSMLGAQYSLPFSVAMALTRDLSDPSVVDESVLQDGLIQRLARSVEVRSDPAHFAQAAGDTSAEIRIESNGSSDTLATASGCQVLGLNKEQVVSALGHAGQQAGGLMATSHGGMGKRLLAGKAAHSGTLAAVLASRGFTNVNNIFECEYGGFCSAFSGARDTYKLEELTRDLGTAWNTPKANFKMWACRVPIHPALEALRDIRRVHGLRADQVEHIRVWLSEGSIKAVGWPWVPTTITSAQLNLQYCAAVYLLEDAVFVEQFREDKLAAPSVLNLTGRIEIIPDVEGAHRGVFHQFVRVEVTTKDGQVWTADGVTRGSADRPISRDDVVEKFRRLVSPDLSPPLQDAMIDACNRLETMADATSLTQFLGESAQGAPMESRGSRLG